METEKDALDAYKEAGVEIPPEAEPKSEPEEEKAPEPEKEEPAEDEPESDKEEDLETEPQPEPKKRSIYKDLKESRKEAKTEKELREQAERERDDFKTKFEALAKADTPAEKQEAKDDLEAFAKEIEADPSLLKRMREVFIKDLPKGEIPEELASQLKEFQEWKETNSKAIEEQQFEQEFKSATPSLTKMFPRATPEESEAIKAKLKELAHTEAYHDKELDYIAFKNQDTLGALISPKKRGLETKGRTDAPENDSFTFDPNADFSKMSAKEAEAWEKEYKKATSSDGLHTDGEGRKIII